MVTRNRLISAQHKRLFHYRNIEKRPPTDINIRPSSSPFKKSLFLYRIRASHVVHFFRLRLGLKKWNYRRRTINVRSFFVRSFCLSDLHRTLTLAVKLGFRLTYTPLYWNFWVSKLYSFLYFSLYFKAKFDHFCRNRTTTVLVWKSDN